MLVIYEQVAKKASNCRILNDKLIINGQALNFYNFRVWGALSGVHKHVVLISSAKSQVGIELNWLNF